MCWRGSVVFVLFATLLLGCEGDGEGQVSGTLFLRGCPSLDPTDRSQTEVPSPLPTFTLNPHFFYAEIILGIKTGLRPDPRTVDRLQVRLQRGSIKMERSDSFELLVHDLDKLEQLQADSIRAGAPGIPIIPPPLDQVTSPLPTSPDATVRAGLVLNNSCRYPQAQPSLRGHIRFSELGRRVGEYLAAEFQVVIEDERAMRQEGGIPKSPNVAGALQGWFRMPIRSGPASAAQ